MLAPHYDSAGHAQPAHWWPSHHPGHELPPGSHLGNGHLPGQQNHLWRGHSEPSGLQGLGNYNGLKPSLEKVKSEARLSTDSQDYGQDALAKQKVRKSREESEVEGDPNQPPKKRGKGKGKAKPQDTNGGPKRVFICPHCQV